MCVEYKDVPGISDQVEYLSTHCAVIVISNQIWLSSCWCFSVEIELGIKFNLIGTFCNKVLLFDE